MLVGLILTALIGPVGTESRGVAVFTHRDMAPLIERTFAKNATVKVPSCFRHGGLYRWRENSLPIFLFQKLKEILTRYSRTILTSSKHWSISKI